MFFFKWYGTNVDSVIEIPAFHKQYKYIKTIGVSVFNKKQSTSSHFGPLRASLRVLYNINNVEDDAAFIVVGKTISHWRHNKLFIFDDTLLHQSFNGSDQFRYCLFVDILRPSACPAVFAFIVGVIHVIMRSAKSIFYKQWKVVQA